jgi:hypothetical protein
MELVSVFNAAVWAGSFYLLGASALTALAILPVVLIADGLNLGHGRVWLWRIGFVLLLVTIFVQGGIIPRLSVWSQSAASILNRY